MGCSEFRTASTYSQVPSETRVCQLPFMCKDCGPEEEQPRKQDAGMGVSIILAKDFEVWHCFGLFCGVCTCAACVKGFAFKEKAARPLGLPGCTSQHPSLKHCIALLYQSPV